MNPLTRLTLFLGFSISTLLSQTPVLLLLHVIVSFFIIFSIRKDWQEWKKRIIPFIKFFPLTGILFFCISFFVSDRLIPEIILDVSLATIRLMVLVNVMTAYTIQAKSQDIFITMRSVWFAIGKPWKWVEDLFLFFDITIRFFPSFQEEWKRVEQSQKALAFKIEKDFFRRLKSIAMFIPDFIILNLNRADTLTTIVLMRGYGSVLPRSVYPFTLFQWSDGIIVLGMLACFMGIHSYVTV